ncbi:MAG TPA: DUF4388 domain-containing protein [Pyrinomonadaceae bacterium]|nr:DUF4388 domain-containing protein [Pyrinomonadaceae bacterium]
MSEMKTVLDVIQSITANRESGRLEINSSGMYGTLLFSEGRLVDARLESLSGFQAVNAAVSLRDVKFNFEHVPPASHASTITPSERVVLKRFFGIEAAEMEEVDDHGEADPDWNDTPEQVVPLIEVEELPKTELEETPTVEVTRIASAPVAPSSSFPWSRVGVAACLALLLALAAGAVVLRSRLKAPQESASVASAVVESQPSSAPVAAPEVKQVEAAPDHRIAKVRDLSGEWRVINTVEKTAYKSFDKMQVGFRLKISQQGKEFTAKGEKFSENGQTLPAVYRTPIRVTGSIEGDKVVATFVEDGKMRRTNGRFIWKLQRGGNGLAGTFVSTAANTSGRSAVTKQQ